jgi:hypothetical protein
MKQHGPLVNWSAVAAAAFRQKLQELDQQTQCRTMEEVVARLRRTDSDTPAPGGEGTVARRCGRRWAMSTATRGQLERLAAFRAQHTETSWLELLGSEDGPRELARQIEPQPGLRKGLWKQVLGAGCGPGQRRGRWKGLLETTERPGRPALAELVAGALEVWEQVQGRL